MQRAIFSRKTILIAIVFLALYAGAVFVFATPPSTPYTPGQTLDPTCAPGDTNCSVTVVFTGTAGSALFVGSDGKIGEDNGNFFWDEANARLGIGIPTPLQALHVVGNFQLVGAFMPGGNAGEAPSAGNYTILTSAGTGTSPTWDTYNFNDIADARIDLQKGEASGLAPLDASSKVPLVNLPATVFSNTFVKNDLDTTIGDKCTDLSSSVVGDVCIAASEVRSYILQAVPGSSAGNWIEIVTPGAPVTSVNGAIGGVTLTGTNGVTVSGTAFSLGGILTHDTTISLAGSNVLLTGTGNVRIGGSGTPAERLVVEGNVQFSGALMPAGNAGTSPTGSSYTGISGTTLSSTEYSVLISEGAGTPPQWETFDFNQLADGRIGAAGGVEGGFAPLDASLRVPLSYLPATVFSNTYVRTNFDGTPGTDCTSISGTVVGDVCIVTSTSTNYILQVVPGSAAGNWVALLTPAGAVSSVNGAIGAVTLTGTNGITASGTTFGLGGTLTAATTIAQAGFAIKFTGSGNFGIGTSLPTQKLDVAGAVKFSGALMPNGTAGTTGQLLMSAGSGAVPTWSTPTYWDITGNAGTTAGTNFVGTTDVIDLVFKTNATERLRITSGYGRLVTSQTGASLLNANTFIDGGNDTFTGTGKNTGIGVAALASLTTGNQNTAVGRIALQNLATGNNNVAMGVAALQNMMGSSNVGLGNSALLGAVGGTATGSNNVGIGTSTATFLTTGASNVVIGNSAATSLTSGSSNIIIGASADSVSTGSTNIVIGASASTFGATLSNQLNIGGWIVGSGGDIGIGTGLITAPANKLEIKKGTAGQSGLRFTNMLSSSTATSLLNGKVLSVNTTGDVTLVDLNEKNTGFWNLGGNAGALSTNFLGTTDSIALIFKTNNVQTGYISAAGTNIFFGPNAGSGFSGAVTNSFFVGSSAGDTATNAANSVFIGQNAGKTGTNASNSTFIGQDAGKTATNAANSIFIGSSAGASDTVNNTAGSLSSILIGNNTGTGGFSDSIALGRSAVNTTSNQMMIGSTTSPINGVRIQGAATQCTILTTTGITCTSDERLKENIVDISSGTLEKLSGVRTVHYNIIGDKTKRYQVGFLAQNLEQYFPELVDTDTEGYKSVFYAQMTPILVQAIRELDLKVSDFDPGNVDDHSLMAILKNWFASTTNGINEMIAGTIRARNQVCIDDVCMTKDQLRTLLQNSGGGGSGGGESSDPAPVPDPVPSDPLPEPEVVPVVEDVPPADEETPPVVEPEAPAPEVPSDPVL